MKTFKYILIPIIIFISYLPLPACTSFAVYGDKIFYGMNFDYPQVELQFSIIHYEGMKVFQSHFIENGNLATVCGMNDCGVFSSIQMLYPQVTSWPEGKENEINLYEAYILALLQVDSLQEAITYIDTTGTRVIHINGSSLHDFFADKYKNACVLEVGAENNLFTHMENDFIVMTNFPNNQFIGKPLEQISGVGADRYKTAFQYIQTNKNTFSFENGIETLSKTMQTSGGYPTQVSLLFDPVNNEVYVILKRDFNKIWKVSVNNETIETFSGFDQYKKMPLTSEGILASQLQSTTSINDNQNLIPGTFKLEQNYPNPFNPQTTISFSIPEGNKVTLKVYNLLGNEISTLINEYKNAGKYSINFSAKGGSASGGDALNLSSGIYFYKLEAGSFTAVRKFILVK
jgi:hypothetical protein